MSVHHSVSSNFPTPRSLKASFPVKNEETILKARKEIADILFGRDKRFLLVMGPCSIHDESSCLNYARHVVDIQKKYSSFFYIVFRCYLEKSRTATGWEGFISSPDVNGHINLEEGLIRGRRLMVALSDMGLPIAYELIDPLIARYFEDVISIASIGARSVRAPIYRYLASSLSFPIAFKNTLEGDLYSPSDSILCASKEHSFLTIDDDGSLQYMKTKGNLQSFLVLRGRKDGSRSVGNYDEMSLQKAYSILKERELHPSLLIDASHDNSERIPALQEKVFLEVLKTKYQTKEPHISSMIRGAMLESFIEEGAISYNEYIKTKKYGISITDACMGLERTAKLLDYAYKTYGKAHLTGKNEMTEEKCTREEMVKGGERKKDITKQRKIAIYTDGACSGNPGRGGWAFVLVEGSTILYKKSGFDKETTNNRMEMMAVIEALKEIEKRDWHDESLTVYTDSSYVKNGITQWIKKWKYNGWRSSSNTPVKNQDLWLLLDSLSISFPLSWKWVKGHAGNKFNELCDSMATDRAKEDSDLQVHLAF